MGAVKPIEKGLQLAKRAATTSSAPVGPAPHEAVDAISAIAYLEAAASVLGTSVYLGQTPTLAEIDHLERATDDVVAACHALRARRGKKAR